MGTLTRYASPKKLMPATIVYGVVQQEFGLNDNFYGCTGVIITIFLNHNI